jgi:hypothetical protein
MILSTPFEIRADLIAIDPVRQKKLRSNLP